MTIRASAAPPPLPPPSSERLLGGDPPESASAGKQPLPVWPALLDFGTGGGVTWLAMAVEERGGTGGGGAILPPGGGGRRLSPPEPVGRDFADPLFLVGMFCKGRKAALRGTSQPPPSPPLETQAGEPHPNVQLNGLPFLEAQVKLGPAVQLLGLPGDFRLLLHPPVCKKISCRDRGGSRLGCPWLTTATVTKQRGHKAWLHCLAMAMSVVGAN